MKQKIQLSQKGAIVVWNIVKFGMRGSLAYIFGNFNRVAQRICDFFENAIFKTLLQPQRCDTFSPNFLYTLPVKGHTKLL